MLNLAPADWLILLIYGFFVLSAGISIQSAIKTSKDYLHLGRTMPGWLCGLAFAAGGLGIQASMALTSLGAAFGLESVVLVLIAGVPAMLFAGIYMMPVYYGSQARTVPEYLGLRFDARTRVAAAMVSLATAIIGIALALATISRIFAALHVFDQPLRAAGVESRGDSLIAMAIPAALVLAYVLLGGLGATVYNQAMQILLLAAGMLPAVYLGLRQIGGWSGLKSAAALADRHLGGEPMGSVPLAVAAGIGLMSGVVFWCSDFRVLQTAMAAKNVRAAQRTPVIAAAAWLVFPLLLLLPGMIALGMPTPRTTIVIHNDNGAIYHEITVVPPADENGQGLVPAVIDPSSGKPLKRSDGHNLLDYAQAVPNVAGHFLPMGLLGLGIAGLLACIMAGIAAGLAACNAVFSADLYQQALRKSPEEKHLIAAGRATSTGAMVLALALAFAGNHWHWDLSVLAMALLRSSGSLLAVILMGMFSTWIKARGVFIGLLAGIGVSLAALLPLPICHAHPLASPLIFAGAGVAVTVLITLAMSAGTDGPADEQLAGLVYSLRAVKTKGAAKQQGLDALVLAVSIAAVGIALLFA